MKMSALDPLFADQKKLALAIVGVCLFIYADAQFVIGAQMKGVTAAKQKIAKTQTDIDQLSRDVALMSKTGDTEQKQLTLEGENNIPEILRSISQLAAANDIKILQIVPLKSREAKVIQGQNYLNLTVKLDLTGGYHDLGTFLNELTRGQHPLFADELRISQGEDFMKQRISLNLRTYVKK